MKKIHPQVLLLCSMIDINHHRLKKLAFDRCHSIDLTFDYLEAPHRSLMKRFYSDVMPHVSDEIQSLTIHLDHISHINSFLRKNSIETLPNLRHLKVMLGAKHSKTGIPYALGNLIIMKLIPI